MSTLDPPTVAGLASTTLFAGSMVPMLVRAARTRDLSSYSRGQLVLSNVGNAVHAVYVYSLPFGPIWLLHAFYVVVTLQMLVWHIRHTSGSSRPADAPQDTLGRGHAGRAT
jgi:hypothetical protein